MNRPVIFFISLFIMEASYLVGSKNIYASDNNCIESIAVGTECIKVNGQNPLSCQFKKSNAIYEINTVIDLCGKSLIIPANCCLFFNGGSLTNGTLIGNHSRIYAPFGRIFSSDVKFQGTFSSDCLRLSWWGTYGSYDNSKEVQAALDAILSFDNRILYFDMPVRITDVSFVLKYSQGVIFFGGSNSSQGANVITVFGCNSHGIDISGTENLQFRNIQFYGEKSNPPSCLLYASRHSDNKQSPGHKFYNTNFGGYATKSFVYNYSGESWSFNDCSFRVESNDNIMAAYYGTTINSLAEKSKFGQMEEAINSLTASSFNGCSFFIRSSAPAVLFEGGINKRGTLKNVTSIYFSNCYFYCELNSSVKLYNCSGNVAFINCVDESGAVNSEMRNTAFIDISGSLGFDGLTLINNTFYAKKDTKLLNADVDVSNYNAQGNKVINNGGVWYFKKLVTASHVGLSPIEKFIAKSGKSVNVITTNEKQTNVFIN